MSPSILTYTGQYFDLLNPEQNAIGVQQIAHALSNICRFTGHCDPFYSVAEHSVRLSYIVPHEHAFAGLFHDAAEAFIGDVAKPLKMLLPDYQVIEKRVEQAVFKALCIALPLPDCIKQADLRMLITEQRDLMPDHTATGKLCLDIEPLPERIEPWTQAYAKQRFFERYLDLWGVGKGERHAHQA